MVRFNIRDLLWLMVVMAILAAWSIDHYRLRGDLRSANRDIAYAFSIVDRYTRHRDSWIRALAERGLELKEQKNGELVVVERDEPIAPR